MSSEQDIHNYKWAFSGIYPLQFYVHEMLTLMHMFYFLLLVTVTRDPKTSQSQKQFGTYLNRCFTKIFIIQWTIFFYLLDLDSELKYYKTYQITLILNTNQLYSKKLPVVLICNTIYMQLMKNSFKRLQEQLSLRIDLLLLSW